jgi:septal ring factor EnvC (AmiA/AmiB activator)
MAASHREVDPDTQTEAHQDIRRDIGKTEQSIQAVQSRRRALAGRARTVGEQIDGLRLRAALAAKQAQEEEAALDATEGRLKVLRAEHQAYRRRLGKMRDGMARSITALAQLQRQPAVAMLAAPGTMLDAARGGRLLAAVLPALHQDAAEVGQLLAAAEDVGRRLQEEQRLRLAAAAALSDRRRELSKLLDERATSERQLRQAGAQEGERLAMLASKVSDLRSLLRRLDREERRARQRASEEADRIAARTAERAANAARGAEPPDAGARAPGGERPRRGLAAEMARVLGAPKAPERAENKPGAKPRQLALAPSAAPFAKLRGRLRLPARGTRVGRYGESTGLGPRAQGITLRTRRDAQVVAPHGGRVVFAGPFRDYGLILIISHGGGYHTLLAGLARLQVVVGQSMLTGEPVGVMGGDGKRSLYIELRRKGTAINPNPWWSSSLERASG